DRSRTRVGFVLLDLFSDDVVAEPDAFVADVDRGPCDEFFDFFLRFAAEGAAQVTALVVVSSSLHFLALKTNAHCRLPRAASVDSSAAAPVSQANGSQHPTLKRGVHPPRTARPSEPQTHARPGRHHARRVFRSAPLVQ